MTTFTSDDREEEYKKIVEAAPYQPGYEDAVPIPFAGWVNTPPHIVDSGASVMGEESTNVEIRFLRQYISDLEKGLESSLNLNKAQAERHGNNEPVAWIAYDEFGDFMLEAKPEGDYPWQPLYAHPAKTLTESEIYEIAYSHANLLTEVIGFSPKGLMQFVDAILKKASEK